MGSVTTSTAPDVLSTGTTPNPEPAQSYSQAVAHPIAPHATGLPPVEGQVSTEWPHITLLNTPSHQPKSYSHPRGRQSHKQGQAQRHSGGALHVTALIG
jgi:hypothetical protein